MDQHLRARISFSSLATVARGSLGVTAFLLLGATGDCLPSDPPPPPGGGGACATSPGPIGTSEHTLQWDGLERSYLLHVPAGLDPSEPVPVVFIFHGFTMSGQIMLDLTGFADIADREGFIAVFPNGEGTNPWNVGLNACAGGPNDPTTDDIGFTKAILEELAAAYCVDRDAVFATGFSMGGYFTHNLACQTEGFLRAAAPHSGGTYPGECVGAPVPMMILHGDADWLVPPECGPGARDYWIERNGCSAEVDTVPVEGGTCEYHRGCPPDGQVALCMFEGMLHGWAGASGSIYAGGRAYEDASELIWQFFEEQL